MHAPWGCGRYRQRRGGLAGDFIVSRLSDLTEKIIPFFAKYPVIGMKKENFEDFCKVAELMKEKAHLTEAGLEQICKLKDGMNSHREGSIES